MSSEFKRSLEPDQATPKSQKPKPSRQSETLNPKTPKTLITEAGLSAALDIDLQFQPQRIPGFGVGV